MNLKHIFAKRDDPAPLKHYLKGDKARVLKEYKTLAKGRWWHYQVRFVKQRYAETSDGRSYGLSKICYLHKDEVTE